MKILFVLIGLSIIGMVPLNSIAAHIQEQSPTKPFLEIVTFNIKQVKDENPPSTCWDTIGSPCQDSPSSAITRTIYDVRVKNTGTMTVQTVWWRYVDVWPTGESYRDYLSAGKIKPGQSTKLALTEYSRKSTAPINPTYSEAERAKHQGKHIVIMCVQYTDGTIWKRS